MKMIKSRKNDHLIVVIVVTWVDNFRNCGHLGWQHHFLLNRLQQLGTHLLDGIVKNVFMLNPFEILYILFLIFRICQFWPGHIVIMAIEVVYTNNQLHCQQHCDNFTWIAHCYQACRFNPERGANFLLCPQEHSEKTDFSEISTQCASNSRLAALLMLILALAMHQQMTTDKAFDNRQGCSKLGGNDIQGLSKPVLGQMENTDP